MNEIELGQSLWGLVDTTCASVSHSEALIVYRPDSKCMLSVITLLISSRRHSSSMYFIIKKTW